MMLKPMADWINFEALDIRAGRVVNVEDSQTKKPTYRLTIDFGPEIGIKKSSAQLIGAYVPEDLIGKIVMGVVNFPPKQIGPFISEVLTLGFKNINGGGFILAVPDKNDIELGDKMR